MVQKTSYTQVYEFNYKLGLRHDVVARFLVRIFRFVPWLNVSASKQNEHYHWGYVSHGGYDEDDVPFVNCVLKENKWKISFVVIGPPEEREFELFLW